MQKNILITVCLAVVLSLSGAHWVWGASQMRSKPPILKPAPPDLAVTVVFAHIESWKNSKGVQCYSPRPVFTIRNNGGSTASNFKYITEWKLNPNHTWSMYSGNTIQSLGPGATKTLDYNNPIAEQPWCVDDPSWKPGWRITADTENTVAESNEGNNVVEKIFTPSNLPQYEPPKAIRKDFRKFPVPRQ